MNARWRNRVGRFGGLSGLMAWLVLSWGSVSPVYAALSGQELHAELVKTAYEYDAFNQRCRGVSAAKNEAKVNRLMIEKYRLTLNNFVKEIWGKDPRETEQQIKQALQETIFKLGGCQQAREKGLEKQLKTDFRQQFEQVEQSPWFPEAY